MTHAFYLIALVVSIAGLVTLDARYRIAIFDRPRPALLTIAIGVVFFLVWDAIGVGLGIFFVGAAPYQTGIMLAPEIPLEELFFLILLVYQTLLLWRWFDGRRASAGAVA